MLYLVFNTSNDDNSSSTTGLSSSHLLADPNYTMEPEQENNYSVIVIDEDISSLLPTVNSAGSWSVIGKCDDC